MERLVLLVERTVILRGLEHQEIGEHPSPNPVGVLAWIIIKNYVGTPQDAILIAEHKTAPSRGVLVEVAHIALQAPTQCG